MVRRRETSVAKYCINPHVAHRKACKRILRYRLATQDKGIKYTPQTFRPSLQHVGLPAGYFSPKRPREVGTYLVSFAIVDLADSAVDRYSVSCYEFFLCGGLTLSLL